MNDMVSMYFWGYQYDTDDEWCDNGVRCIACGIATSIENAKRDIKKFMRSDVPHLDSVFGIIKEFQGTKVRTVMSMDVDGEYEYDGEWHHLEEEEGCLFYETVEL